MKVAIDENNNVLAFVYQDKCNAQEVDCEVTPSFIDEPIFTKESVNRFYVEDGIVKKKTDEEIKADPQYVVYQKQHRAEAYKTESDPIFFKVQRGEATNQDWLDKMSEIKGKYPY